MGTFLGNAAQTSTSQIFQFYWFFDAKKNLQFDHFAAVYAFRSIFLYLI